MVNRVREIVFSGISARLAGRCRDWYAELAERERRLVLIAVVAVPVMILIFGIWLPLQDRIGVLQKEKELLYAQVQEAKALALALEQKPDSGVRRGLLGMLDAMARQAGLRQYVTQLRPQVRMGRSAERVQVQVQNAPFDTLIRFLDLLDKQGVSLESVAMIEAGEPGKVNVRLLTGL